VSSLSPRTPGSCVCERACRSFRGDVVDVMLQAACRRGFPDPLAQRCKAGGRGRGCPFQAKQIHRSRRVFQLAGSARDLPDGPLCLAFPWGVLGGEVGPDKLWVAAGGVRGRCAVSPAPAISRMEPSRTVLCPRLPGHWGVWLVASTIQAGRPLAAFDSHMHGSLLMPGLACCTTCSADA
jgi:hypothetical protein